MVEKIEILTDEAKKNFYNELAARLLEAFAMDYYEDEEELQNDFHEWKTSDIKDYRATLDEILSEITPEGIELTWRDCKKINRKRFRMCKVCKKPFIAYDRLNQMKFCYTSTYKRYKTGTREKEGAYYKSSFKGLSTCYMIYDSSRNRINDKDTYEYTIGF